MGVNLQVRTDKNPQETTVHRGVYVVTFQVFPDHLISYFLQQFLLSRPALSLLLLHLLLHLHGDDIVNGRIRGNRTRIARLVADFIALTRQITVKPVSGEVTSFPKA
jgi:hypothetical protein